VHVLITTRHLDNLPDAAKTYAEEKLGRLPKYYDLIQEIEVIIKAGDQTRYHTEVIVNAEHKNMFVANCTADTVQGCVDGCYQKLERQLTEHKNKHRNRKHADASSIRHSAV
jgi:ribosomal subunit interface protein